MLDLRSAPLTGATLITDRSWKKISAEDRTRMLEVAAASEKKIQAQAPTLDSNAIRDMEDSTKTRRFHFGSRSTRLPPHSSAPRPTR
jgi:TRAP-type C4-dicarboxylate transport system substrate-binding protein